MHDAVPGDSRAVLTAEYSVTLEALQLANPQLQDVDYDIPGEVVQIPQACSGMGNNATVSPGETVEDISKDHNIDLDCLVAENPRLFDNSAVDPGDCIMLPQDCPPYFNGGNTSIGPSISESTGFPLELTRSATSGIVSILTAGPIEPTALAIVLDNDSIVLVASEEIVIGSTTYLLGPDVETIIDEGKTVVIGGSAGILVGSQTISLPQTGTGILTTDGITISFSNIPLVRTIVVDGETITLNGSETTLTEPFPGPTVIFEPSDIVIGMDILPYPTNAITTDGVTFSIPSSSSSTSPIASVTPPMTTASIPPPFTLPSITSSPPPPFTLPTITSLPTFNIFPTGSVGTGSSTAATATHTDIVSGGKTISFPVLPCLICGCWFCLPKFGSFTLFGFELPGIYPPGPPPPGFSIAWPAITIGFDGNPTFPSEPPKQPTSTGPSSSCAASVVNSCAITTICPTPTIAQTAAVSCSTTTTCAQITGCSVTATTSVTCINSPSSTPGATCPEPVASPYVVYPVDGTNSALVGNIENQLSALDVPRDSPFFTSSSQYLGTLFWYAVLTPSQVSALETNHNVSSVNEPQSFDPTLARDDIENVTDQGYMDSDSLVGANPITRHENTIVKRSLLSQHSAVDDVVFISQPPGVSLASLDNTYTYDSSAGAGQVVYLLDFGVDIDNQEFDDIRPSAEWLYPGPNAVTTGPQDNKGHGTCMLSRISGKQFGTSKLVKPVISVINYPAPPEAFLDGLKRMFDHVINNKNQGKAVLSMSLNWKKPWCSSDWREVFKFVLQEFVSQGVSIITGAGNSGKDPLDGWPALWAEPLRSGPPDIPELLVVGAVNNSGFTSINSQSGQSVRIYAPGAPGTWCAALGGGTKQSSGTSISCATVAGLAAYFRGTGIFTQRTGTETWADTVDGLKSEISRLAYPRATDPNVLGIWNNENAPTSCALGKRQGTIATGCLPSSTTSTSITSAQPSPTIVGSIGFHVVGLLGTNSDKSANNAVEVIGSQSNICSHVANNKDKYEALPLYVEGVNATLTGVIKDPSGINSSTTEFALVPYVSTQGTIAGLPLCGIPSQPFSAMVFTNMGSGTFAYKDSAGNSGTCIPSPSTTACTDAAGNAFTMVDLLFCEVAGNPSFCSEW